MLPEITQEPVIRNPFPQLSRVAVAPFFNQSDEPTVDGREFAIAYFTELQATPGFEVVPVGVVEEAIIAHRIDLSSPGEARRLATILGVDAVAVGAVTDFYEYYPPRVGLRVEWYTSNPGFHEIPAGYGLPWGTPEEEFIPDSLVYESQMALARAEMAGRSPDCDAACQPLPAPPPGAAQGTPAKSKTAVAPVEEEAAPEPERNPFFDPQQSSSLKIVDDALQRAQAIEPLPLNAAANSTTKEIAPQAPDAPAMAAAGAVGAIDAAAATVAGGVVRPAPGACCPENDFLGLYATGPGRAPCIPFNGPVLSHTGIYRGNDNDVTEALEGYVFFRDDLRFGGWKSYLNRSDDYIRFCCHMHICEMLSARGGSRRSEVLMRWPESR